MNEQIHIGIAEDHELVRQGLVVLLKEHERIKVDFDVRNGQELMDRLKTTMPHIILLDLEMPVMTGKEALAEIKRLYPQLKVIIVSGFYHETFVMEYIKMGANSFLPKHSNVDRVVNAIYAVQKYGVYFDNKTQTPEITKPVIAPPVQEKVDLTEQEIIIIKLICQHMSSKEIADELSLSKKTIDYHRSKIMRKTDSRNIAALIEYAVQNKLVKML